jgi:hypothetical protein
VRGLDEDGLDKENRYETVVGFLCNADGPDGLSGRLFQVGKG